MTTAAVATSAHAEPHVELRGVGKRFGGVLALVGIDLTIERGSIHISRPLQSWVSIHERDDVDHFALSDA